MLAIVIFARMLFMGILFNINPAIEFLYAELATLLAPVKYFKACSFWSLNQVVSGKDRNNLLCLLLFQLQKKLHESQEVNKHLRGYIDNILLVIVEKNPQLLEVKQKPSSSQALAAQQKPSWNRLLL